MWIIDQMSPGNPAYNSPIAYRIRGELDVHVPQESFNQIMGRHESWRTTFRESDGNPVQDIHPECKIRISITDLEHLPIDEREPKLLALASEEAAKPFDLRRLPLHRVSLFKVGHGEHVLLITLHHIIFDVWSSAVLAREEGVTKEVRTLPVAIPTLITTQGVKWGEVSIVSIFALIPVFLVVFFLQRHIVRGLTLGALKG
jgi:hypothetical protein